MNMYIPAKFQVNPISFEGFMGGGMFCPPPDYYSSKKPGLDRVKLKLHYRVQKAVFLGSLNPTGTI